MKKYLILLTAVLMTAGCGDSKRIAGASRIAEEFISAYTGGDFDRAGALCSDHVRKRVEAAATILSPLDSNARAAAVSATSGLKWEKEVIEDGDESVVTLRYSTVFNDRKTCMTLKLSQSGKDAWSVIWME